MSRVLRCLVIVAALWPLGALASEDQVVRRWTFKTESDAAGWVAGGDAKSTTVVDGALRVVTTGPDAYVFAPPVETSLDGCVVRVWMRCEQEASSQVYWTTADKPEFGEGQVLSVAGPLTTDGTKDKFVTWEFPIGRAEDRGRKLTRFRIDPYNGGQGGTVDIAAVELVRTATVLDVNFSFAEHWVELGKPVTARVTVRHVGGRVPEALYNVTFSDGRKAQVAATSSTSPEADQALTPAVEFKFDRPGVHHVRANIAGLDGKTRYDLETSIIADKAGTLPIVNSLVTENVRLDLVKMAGGERVGAARWMATDASGEWKLAGWLMPLLEIATPQNDGRIARAQPALAIGDQTDSSLLELVYEMTDADNRPSTRIEVTAVPHGNQHQVRITTGVYSSQDIHLLELSGPVVLVDRDPPGDLLNRYALFGGLEFLEPGWASSSDQAVGERFAARWSPAPHKVTLPAMAIEAQGLTTAMIWNIEPHGRGNAEMPAATFASPNSLDGQANHLMRLSLPAGVPWRQENENLARQVYSPPKGLRLGLEYLLHAEPELPVARVAQRWYDTFMALPAPKPTHDDPTLYDLIARNFGETMWSAEEKGWRRHWFLGEKPSPHAPEMAGELIAHAAKTGEKHWVQQTGIEGQMIIDAAGTLADRLQADAHAKAMLAGMRPDGTWAFTNTPALREQVRKFTDGKHDSLGEDGSTSLGTCVQAALPILHYAEISGDPQFVEAGLKALAAMRRFRVPRGAQVWEVHQDIPDIRAAALAVEAFRIGFHLSGDQKYLEDANYWGWTGVQFVYAWAPPMDQDKGGMFAARNCDGRGAKRRPFSEGFQQPQREVMPYATVPVLGPTFYVINWFGVVVQWCGLEWAEKVIELDAERSDPLLRYVADGVVASGLQQMFDQPPWVGLYPDVWNVEQNLAQGAFIYAGLPLRCLRAQGRTPPWTQTWTRVLHEMNGTMTWHVSGWGKMYWDLPDPSTVSWTAKLEYPAGQANELVIAGAAAPKRVRVDGEELRRADVPATSPPADTIAAQTPGWRYLSERKVVVVRFISPAGGKAEIRIEW